MASLTGLSKEELACAERLMRRHSTSLEDVIRGSLLLADRLDRAFEQGQRVLIELEPGEPDKPGRFEQLIW